MLNSSDSGVEDASAGKKKYLAILNESNNGNDKGTSSSVDRHELEQNKHLMNTRPPQNTETDAQSGTSNVKQQSNANNVQGSNVLGSGNGNEQNQQPQPVNDNAEHNQVHIRDVQIKDLPTRDKLEACELKPDMLQQEDCLDILVELADLHAHGWRIVQSRNKQEYYFYSDAQQKSRWDAPVEWIEEVKRRLPHKREAIERQEEEIRRREELDELDGDTETETTQENHEIDQQLEEGEIVGQQEQVQHVPVSNQNEQAEMPSPSCQPNQPPQNQNVDARELISPTTTNSSGADQSILPFNSTQDVVEWIGSRQAERELGEHQAANENPTGELQGQAQAVVVDQQPAQLEFDPEENANDAAALVDNFEDELAGAYDFANQMYQELENNDEPMTNAADTDDLDVPVDEEVNVPKIAMEHETVADKDDLNVPVDNELVGPNIAMEQNVAQLQEESSSDSEEEIVVRPGPVFKTHNRVPKVVVFLPRSTKLLNKTKNIDEISLREAEREEMAAFRGKRSLKRKPKRAAIISSDEESESESSDDGIVGVDEQGPSSSAGKRRKVALRSRKKPKLNAAKNVNGQEPMKPNERRRSSRSTYMPNNINDLICVECPARFEEDDSAIWVAFNDEQQFRMHYLKRHRIIIAEDDFLYDEVKKIRFDQLDKVEFICWTCGKKFEAKDSSSAGERAMAWQAHRMSHGEDDPLGENITFIICKIQYCKDVHPYLNFVKKEEPTVTDVELSDGDGDNDDTFRLKPKRLKKSVSQRRIVKRELKQEMSTTPTKNPTPAVNLQQGPQVQQAIAQPAPAFQFPSFGPPEPQIIVVGEQQEEEQDEDEQILPRSKAVVKQKPSKVAQPSRVIKRELTQSISMASTSAPSTSHQHQMPSTSAAGTSSNSNQDDGICKYCQEHFDNRLELEDHIGRNHYEQAAFDTGIYR